MVSMRGVSETHDAGGVKAGRIDRLRVEHNTAQYGEPIMVGRRRVWVIRRRRRRGPFVTVDDEGRHWLVSKEQTRILRRCRTAEAQHVGCDG